MAIVCEVKFGSSGRSYLCEASEQQELKVGDNIIVSYNDCNEFAVVIKKPFEIEDEKVQNVGTIKRVANQKDYELKNIWSEKSKEASKKVLEAIKKFELSMKLVEVRYAYDGSKIFINYIAENRVDFRELVKYLASIFKTRVELRQISQREEAKMFGGCGICGKELCCSKFLGEGSQVSIKMAKLQNLALNPSKINGVCGRLLCCLKYENDNYTEYKKNLPDVGSKIKITEGEGKVISVDVFNKKYRVLLNETNEIIEKDASKK